MRLFVAVLAASLALGACDDGGGSFEDVQGVVDAMEDEGIECEDLDTTDEFGSESDALVKERGLCIVEGEPVAVSLFEDAGDRKDWVAVADAFSDVAASENWAVSTDARDLLEEIGAALGGTITGQEEEEEDE